MSRVCCLSMLIDKSDYEKKVTKDEVVNVIGLKGSGKTTLSNKYINDNDYIVINCDKLLEIGEFKEDNNDGILKEIKRLLISKFGNIKDGRDFIDSYNEIINYAFLNGKKLFIEGDALQDIEDISLLKGLVIVKRTAVFKSFIRAVKRDYHNEYFMKMEIDKYGKFGKIVRLYNVIKRRKKIFKESIEINNIIKMLEELK